MRLTARSIALICTISILVSACEPMYFVDKSTEYIQTMRLIDAYQLERKSNLVFPASANFLVARNADEDNQYAQEAVSDALQRSFDYFFNSVTVAEQKKGVMDAIRNARVSHQDYLLYPRLEVWDTALNQWRAYSHERLPRLEERKSQQSLLGAKSWKSAKSIAVQDGKNSAQLRLELVIYDVPSGLQVDTIRLKTRIGFFSDSFKRPLEVLEEPLMSLAEVLSGDGGYY